MLSFKHMTFLIFLHLSLNPLFAQSIRQQTYCNPLNIDYAYMIYNSDRDLSYRSGADPAVVEFRGEYYMFVTRSMGYWHSTNLQNWDFIKPQRWYFEGANAPTAFNYKDSVLYVTGDPSGQMSILFTNNPKKGDWKATPSILNNLQDPMLFIDDNDSAYMFWGSSNTYPIRVKELQKNKRFIPTGKTAELFTLHGDEHGWERFGENHADTVKGYMEGAWMTKHNNKYYLQYAAPGTEFNVYGDGVYVAKHPLGPYVYQQHNPVSYKPGGFINGAGHGSSVLGPQNQYWHFASMSLSANVNWERRLCMFPMGFDTDGIMYCDTRFGDYPHFAPNIPGKKGEFSGWMLLSYNKKVTASGALQNFTCDKITDENVKTFWVAPENNHKQWLEIDLENPADVYAIQVNYFDYKSDLYGKIPDLQHRYIIKGSLNGKDWFVLVNRSKNFKDVPNDYVELGQSQKAQFIRFENIKAPTPNLAISDIRVFGLGSGKAPDPVKKLTVNRHADRRDITLNWEHADHVQGYNILWGIAPNKLYSSWMVYHKNTHTQKNLNINQKYYFAIEAFNENGVSAISKVIEVP